jgi:hypothetical protein
MTKYVHRHVRDYHSPTTCDCWSFAGEPALVSAAASLLTCILAHNRAALSRLYLSGVFLFCLAYCGSNLEELAGLFKTAHLLQGFRCGWLLRWRVWNVTCGAVLSFYHAVIRPL